MSKYKYLKSNISKKVTRKIVGVSGKKGGTVVGEKEMEKMAY